MCNHRLLVTLSIMTCSVSLAPRSAAAQTTEEARARLGMLAESLAAVSRQEELRAEKERPRADTMRMGPMRIAITAQVPANLRAAVPLAWQLLRHRYGDLADSVSGIITISPGTDPEVGAEQLWFALTPVAERWKSDPLYSAAKVPTDSLAVTIAEVAARSVWPRTGPQLREWLQGDPPYSTTAPSDLQQLYIELVTNRWHAGRECFEGDLGACRRALGAVTTARPGTDWYDASDQRALVRQLASVEAFRARAGQVQDCLERAVSAICDFLLSEIPREWIQPSLSTTARRWLLAVALKSGGAEGFKRLGTRSPIPVEDQLALAAALPIDSVIRQWRSEILLARPPVVTVAVASGWMAFFWAVLLATLALGSTRWR